MKLRLFGIITFVAGIFSATVSSAQTSQILPQDPAIKSCVFPNGLSCYVAENASSKGIADVSLIKRDYSGKDLIIAHKNQLLSSETAVDSMFLGIVRQVERDQIPADCAIIVSGDVQADVLMTKLKYMSLMVDSSAASPMPEYTWDSDGKVEVSTCVDSLKGLSTVHISWQAPRVPAEAMNTVRTAIYEKAAWEMGQVACGMIKRNLLHQNIPFAEVSFRHDGSTHGLNHEMFSFDVTVSHSDAAMAQNVAQSVLSVLDNGHAGLDDILLAEREYLQSLDRSARRTIFTNDEYTQICRNAFLYNAPLSTDRQRLDFFCSKSVSETSRQNIFSNIASALIDVDASQDSLECVPSGYLLSDTLGLPGMTVKMKVKSSRKDNFSGGYVWTFANGVKAIYHKMPSTERKLYYSMSLNGGYGNIENLERGEGAHMSDYVRCCWVAGMKFSDFSAVLNRSGMTLDTRVKMYKTFISGHVEDRNAGLMMKALLAVCNECRPDSLQADYYSRCERLRWPHFTGTDIRMAVDSLLSPGYRYTSFKTAEGVRQETFAKAETLFSSLTSKVNDGLLVIVGDMNESELKKQLQVYVGGFKVKNVASRRPSIQYHPVSGWSTCCVEGKKDASALVISTPLAMTSVNHYAAEIAVMALERRVKEEFLHKGIGVKVAFSRDIYPDERFSVFVELSGTCDQDDMMRLKDIVSDCHKYVTEEELNTYKEHLKNLCSRQMPDPQYWLRVVPLRHLEGKDYTTGYAAKIDAVSLQMLQHVLDALDEGAGLEYITIRNK